MLDDVIARLQAQCPTFAVIDAAPSGAAITTVEASAASSALKTLLAAAVGDVYALDIPEGKQPTDAVYRLVAARPMELEGVRIVTQVTFVVTVRATDYAGLMTALGDIESAVDSAAEAISINDASLDFDETRNHYLADLELLYAVPAVPAGSGSHWPALLVDVEDYTGRPSAYDNTIKQRVDRAYSFTVLTAGDDMTTLRGEVEAALLGWEQPGGTFPFEFASGGAVTVPGGLTAWRDIYADGALISQP